MIRYALDAVVYAAVAAASALVLFWLAGRFDALHAAALHAAGH